MNNGTERGSVLRHSEHRQQLRERLTDRPRKESIMKAGEDLRSAQVPLVEPLSTINASGSPQGVCSLNTCRPPPQSNLSISLQAPSRSNQCSAITWAPPTPAPPPRGLLLMFWQVTWVHQGGPLNISQVGLIRGQRGCTPWRGGGGTLRETARSRREVTSLLASSAWRHTLR